LKNDGDETVVIDLAESYVPENTDALYDKESEETHTFQPTKYYLNWCDGFIIVSPEWNGMTPGKLIAFMQAVGRSFAHKPGLIVTNSKTRGGAYPASLLRGFTTKNSHILWVPEQLIIRTNKDMLKDEPVSDDDIYIQKRARYVLGVLRYYVETLTPGRVKLLESLTDFPNGM
jgi:multimeric flavodoxin WrbA